MVEWLFLDSNILAVNAYSTTIPHYTNVRICIKFHILKHCIDRSISFLNSPLRLENESLKGISLYKEVCGLPKFRCLVIHRSLMTELIAYTWCLWTYDPLLCIVGGLYISYSLCKGERVQILNAV